MKHPALIRFVIGTCLFATSSCIGNAQPDFSKTTTVLVTNGIPSCPAAPDACHMAGTWDASTHACSAPQPKADGTACDDHNACTQKDTCQSGVCAAGEAVTCVPTDTCHSTTCEPSVGCQSTATDALCSTTLEPETLNGCWLSVYGLPTNIGGTSYNMRLDTGSNLMALAVQGCTSCDGTTPTYALTANTRLPDPNDIVFQAYGDGSNITGLPLVDTYQAGKLFGAVDMTFVAIVDTNTTGTKRFFQTVDCDLQQSYTYFQGIAGAGNSDAPGHGVSNLMGVMAATKKGPDAFTVQLCDRGGFMWFGGYDATHMKAAPQYVPFVSDTYFYRVAVASLQIGAAQAPSAASVATIVDTGSSATTVPAAVYQEIATLVTQDPNYLTYFEPSLFNGIQCAAPKQAITRDQLDALLPKMTLNLMDTEGKPVRMELPATRSYLLPVNSAGVVTYCSALASGNDMILGAGAMTSHTLVFDRSGQRLGIAPQQGCPAQ